MGTVLLATRVFKSFRERFRSAKISVAVHNSWSVLIQKDPTIDEIITFGDQIEDPFSKEFREIGRELKERNFDLAFFLSYQFADEMAYLTRLSGADLRVSFRGSKELNYFNVEIVPSSGIRYEVERYLEMLRTLGIESSIRDYTMTISESIREKARLRFLLTCSSSTQDKLVGFDLTREIVGNPISKKNAEYVIKTLISGVNAKVAVCFEPGGKALAADLKESFGKDIILVEDRPVSMLAGMMSLCRFIVTHNTDMFQLAVALKTPTLTCLTEDEMLQWSPGESKYLVHLKRSNGSWPSSDQIIQSVKQIIKQTGKKQ